ncbi:MAG TPA: citrate/2-methylcitrate synthase [Planctomycetaceae bacterium]|nr:citrate/2-methylcitrate synthase [Planctomycetaceae bacterium]
MSQDTYFPGLEGVVAGETAVSTIEGGLSYRGYAIEDLARDAHFPEVAYLLLHGELPSQEQLADFQSILAESAELPDAVLRLLADLPVHAGAMDVLRTGISAVAHFDPQLDEDGRAANIGKTVRLLAQIPLLIAARHRLSRGLNLLEPSSELSFAANLLHLITGRQPTAVQERAMDVSLILYAEHEFNASTFTARTVTSTGSDLHSAITAAVGALKGPLHGGANERVMEVLAEVGSAANAERWVRDALAQKRRIMGFGHRVYKTGDPRAVILRDYCRQLAQTGGDLELEGIADTIERIVGQEKGLPPNLDWPSARLYHYLGLEVELYTPLFVASRVVGWAAHVIEQSENNRLIRPRSRYVGPARRPHVPIGRRG